MRPYKHVWSWNTLFFHKCGRFFLISSLQYVQIVKIIIENDQLHETYAMDLSVDGTVFAFFGVDYALSVHCFVLLRLKCKVMNPCFIQGTNRRKILALLLWNIAVFVPYLGFDISWDWDLSNESIFTMTNFSHVKKFTTTVRWRMSRTLLVNQVFSRFWCADSQHVDKNPLSSILNIGRDVVMESVYLNIIMS